MMFENDMYIAIELLVACGLIVLALLAFWPALKAHRKGHDFIKWYLFGLFVFPVALIASFMIKDERDDNEGNG